EDQQQGTIPTNSVAANQALTDGLVTIFNESPIQSSRHQLHFEKRKVIDLEFICRIIPIENGVDMLGIEAMIDSNKIKNIREFLANVKKGSTMVLSPSLTYDPSLHCFQKETDD